MIQIEDLSQQAQMVAAEKFKAPEPSPVAGETPSTVAQTIAEESDEEVRMISNLSNVVNVPYDILTTILVFQGEIYLSD